MKLVSVSEMKAVEAAANARGVTYAQMMQRAGAGVAEVVLRELGRVNPLCALGLVGAGNNGGDTLVALTVLQESGWQTRAYLTRAREAGDELAQALVRAGGKMIDMGQDGHFAILDDWLEECPVLLDGVLGTGFQLPLRPELETLLAHVYAHAGATHVIAVDCPSGVDCDSGEISAAVIPAEITVCMAAVKKGVVRFPAYERVGRLEVVEIGLPEGLPEWLDVRAEVVDEERVRACLPQRRMDGHKGSFGTLMVVGGSSSYTGAPALAARAAYRMGCGLLRVAIAEPLYPALAGVLLEATWLLLPHRAGAIAADAAAVVVENLARVDALLLGPGMGQEKVTADFVARCVSEGGRLPPLVVDADGLRLLARVPYWERLIPATAILTPHPGEMAALTGMSVEQIQADREGITRKYSAQWGHVVVLKGALTVIAAPDGRWGVIPVATSALAKAGTGDVLAGMVGALRSQGLAAYEAAVCAAWMHAQAGLVAECSVGTAASVMAGDVVEAIAEVYQQLE